VIGWLRYVLLGLGLAGVGGSAAWALRDVLGVLRWL
jgi:hypothetical protein